MSRIFARAYAPSTLGSFLRVFTFGHVRQLDAVAARFLVALAGLTRLLGGPAHGVGIATDQDTRCSMSTTPSSRSMVTPSRAPSSASPRSLRRRGPSESVADSWCGASRTSTLLRSEPPARGTLFDVWRFHAFFTTADPAILDTVAADKTHRAHAIIEQVHADLKNSALAHLPSGVFTANAAWLVLAVMAFNLTRAAARLTEPQLAKATTATIRRKLIAVPARAATSGRRIILHLPAAWPWRTAWTHLFDRVSDPPASLTS
jgi:hypothetical protein